MARRQDGKMASQFCCPLALLPFCPLATSLCVYRTGTTVASVSGGDGMKIINVVGARPNFMKIAPIVREMDKYEYLEHILLHTGQHYDDAMSKVFFEDLALPKPDIDLGVGSGSHAVQTAKVMVEFETVVNERKPDLVVVVGDVNSTLACSLVAVKLGVPVAHVEAGLRSFDRSMPEEINRIVTDALSDLLFTTELSANHNLEREGIQKEKIHFVGNVMIDTLLYCTNKVQESSIIDTLNLISGEFALLTLHRPSNVDVKETFEKVISALEKIQKQIQIIFPMHPRTKARISEFGMAEKFERMTNFVVTEPLGYLDFLNLESNCKFVLTDSGGLQEETTVLGIPCLTLRENTERPVTITEGTNILVGTDPEKIIEESTKILSGKGKSGRIPKFWDGKAAERIVEIICRQKG
jgi:UDP-N-acetylglucosamine 2-epimerase (non-hydrolysing)